MSGVYSKSQKTKQFIIEQSAAIFNKHGYSGTSLSDLQESTGLTKGAIYGNFENKEEIALQAFEYNSRWIIDSIRSILESKRSTKNKFLAILDFYRDNYSKLARTGGCPLLNSMVDADDTFPRLFSRVSKVIKGWKAGLVQVLENGNQAGEISLKNPEAFASFFIAGIEGAVFTARSTGNVDDFYQVLNQLKEVIETKF